MITVHADPAREGRTLYKWETSFYSRVNDILKPRNSGSRTDWVHLFLHEVSDTHPSVQIAMEHLELFLSTRSVVDKWSQTPHSTRAQQGSLPAFSASTTPVIDKVGPGLDIAFNCFLTDYVCSNKSDPSLQPALLHLEAP
jgi:hypothetical protein